MPSRHFLEPSREWSTPSRRHRSAHALLANPIDPQCRRPIHRHGSPDGWLRSKRCGTIFTHRRSRVEAVGSVRDGQLFPQHGGRAAWSCPRSSPRPATTPRAGISNSSPSPSQPEHPPRRFFAWCDRRDDIDELADIEPLRERRQRGGGVEFSCAAESVWHTSARSERDEHSRNGGRGRLHDCRTCGDRRGRNHVVARLIKPKGYTVFPTGHRALQSNKVAGYYTLAATSVAFNSLPADLTKRLPHYPVIPAMLLGLDPTFVSPAAIWQLTSSRTDLLAQ